MIKKAILKKELEHKLLRGGEEGLKIAKAEKQRNANEQSIEEKAEKKKRKLKAVEDLPMIPHDM